MQQHVHVMCMCMHICMCMCMRLPFRLQRRSHPRVALVHARLLQRKQLAQPDRTAVHERPAAPVGIDGDRPARAHLQAEEKNCGKSTGRRAGANAPKSRSNNCGKSSTGRTGRRALAHLKTETKRVEKKKCVTRTAGASAPKDRNKTSAVRKRNTARRQDGAGAPTAPRVWRGWRRPR